MKKRLNILCILVFIVLGLSLYTTGYQFGTGMKAGMSLAKEQHKEPKQCDGTMLAGDFRFVDVVPTIAMIKPDTIINAQSKEKVPVMYTQMAVRIGKDVNYSYLIISSSCSLMNTLLTISALIIFVMLILSINKSQIFEWKNVRLAGQFADHFLSILPDSSSCQLLGIKRSIRTRQIHHCSPGATSD